jgi:5-deoxy-glucuronate isomerase
MTSFHHPYAYVTIMRGQGHQPLFNCMRGQDTYLGMEAMSFSDTGLVSGRNGDEERLLVLLNGHCEIEADGLPKTTLERKDPFIDKPGAVYVGAQAGWRVSADAGTTLLVPTAKSNRTRKAEAILPPAVTRKKVGRDNWQREVNNILADTSAISDRLIVGESIHPPGNWSGVPPHRHDRRGGNPLEEIYFILVKPEQSYGVIVLYDEDGAEAVLLRNNSALSFSSGFHPMVAAPGTSLYYLWAMAGARKEFAIQVDDRFAFDPQPATAIS